MPDLNKANLSGNEISLEEDEIIVSKTDLSGKITYGNRTFYKFAGLDENSCIGTQHNVVRHPDMPRVVFDMLWETIAGGQEIFAYVMNRHANGDHYWVFAHVTPSRDSNGQISGYHSNRRKPNRSVIDDHIIPLYAQLKQIEDSDPMPKDGLSKARASVNELLANAGMTFNQHMFALGI